ncbi:alanine racemase [Leptospira gomenensis]|uniref:Alanine racemase n=1 Tax=Leptospira gomenensis TaxID=2484974 RepID=A0A5F1YF28_9LEPT|nr:alanine racemase [Leptospira gomenensis]TGK32602.1 alanine racemase [Leptospira gomenensis]TGK38332.1 alanine racemase [Leptospira gomenensis]TGK52146.1 alanine racemase [Leptospira gomenensis]TGK63000.1 alanine racemase [Leptospira gomenensis]
MKEIASSWVEISKRALRTNLNSFRSVLRSGSVLTAVLKSNAYGHGLETMARLCVAEGVTRFGVNSLEEALRIRNLFPSIEILIMGEIQNPSEHKDTLADSAFHVVFSRIETARILSSLVPAPKLHLKVDTGMGRLGTHDDSLRAVLSELKDSGIVPDGICTHFASTEDVLEHKYSLMQIRKFEEAVVTAGAFGFKNLIRHACASASTMLFPDAHYEMTRIGISLYGLWPSMQTRLSLHLSGNKDFRLDPVLSWKTRIVHVQNHPANSFIGYGSTFQTTYPTKVAVVPIGYYEGLDRKLSSNGDMLVLGKRARILGRICMNMSMLDVTHIPGAEVGSVVTVLGKDGEESVTADDMADRTHTINYETVTRISESIPRIVVD